MHSVAFDDRACTPSAIPITFATKATWEAVARRPCPRRRGSSRMANGFAAKPGHA